MSDKWPACCEHCGSLELPFGVCASCGWRCPGRIELDAQQRKGGVPKVRRRAERGSLAKPRTIVKTLGGEILRADFACPVCNGKGWTNNWCNACYLCLGHGTVSGIRRAAYLAKKS